MIRFVLAIALVCVMPVMSQAAELTLNFQGTITSVVDANTAGLPAINIPDIPVGSTFSGAFTYDTDSPRTDGGTGYSRYVNMDSSSGSLTVNGVTFTSGVQSVSAIVNSQESGFGFTGVSYVHQPITLPDGWSVDFPEAPYFTLQFRDVPQKVRAVTLPATLSEIPTDQMKLVLDFQQPVTINGQTYGGRVFVNGLITSLSLPTKEVDIDITDKKINLNAKKPKPLEVAVFGSVDFDVLSVVPETIGLGDPDLDKAPPMDLDYLDIDGDGELDLRATFSLLSLQEFGAIDSFSTLLEFEATLDDPATIVFGSDSVSIAGSKGKGAK